jgi:hypothetical protein
LTWNYLGLAAAAGPFFTISFDEGNVAVLTVT